MDGCIPHLTTHADGNAQRVSILSHGVCTPKPQPHEPLASARWEKRPNGESLQLGSVGYPWDAGFGPRELGLASSQGSSRRIQNESALMGLVEMPSPKLRTAPESHMYAPVISRTTPLKPPMLAELTSKQTRESKYTTHRK